MGLILNVRNVDHVLGAKAVNDVVIMNVNYQCLNESLDLVVLLDEIQLEFDTVVMLEIDVELFFDRLEQKI